MDVRFPCLEFTMTPVLLPLTSKLLSHISIFERKLNEFNKIKMTKDAISFLEGESKTQIKVFELDSVKQ